MLKILPDLIFFVLVISLQFLTYYSNSQKLVFKFKFSYDPNFFLCHLSLSGGIVAGSGMISTLKYM